MVPTSVTYLCTAASCTTPKRWRIFDADIAAELDLFLFGDVHVIELLLALLRLLHAAPDAAELREGGSADSENRDDDDRHVSCLVLLDLENGDRPGLAFHHHVAERPKLVSVRQGIACSLAR